MDADEHGWGQGGQNEPMIFFGQQVDRGKLFLPLFSGEGVIDV